MPELPFPDLATPVARATEPPPFEQVLARARRRRRRAVLAAAATTVGVLAIVATGAALTTGERHASPPTVDHPSPTPSGSPTPSATADPTPDADTIVRTGNMVSFAAGPAGALLTVWQACTGDELRVCHAAWLLQTAGGRHSGTAPGDSPSAHAAGDSFVVKAWNRAGIVVTADGATRPLVDGDPGELTGDDALVSGRSGLLVADARSGTTWPLPRPDGIQRWDTALITTDATTWATSLVGDRVQIWWTTDPARTSSWNHRALPTSRPGNDLPGYVAAAGDHVATMSGSDGATILPVVVFAVTTDGGATWRDLQPADVPFQNVDAMAATSDGTLFVTAENGHGGVEMFRTTDTTWTRFVEMPNASNLTELVAVGDRVLARGGSFEEPVLVALDSGGHSTPVPVAR